MDHPLKHVFDFTKKKVGMDKAKFLAWGAARDGERPLAVELLADSMKQVRGVRNRSYRRKIT